MSTESASIPDGLTVADLKPRRAGLFLGLVPITAFVALVGLAFTGLFGGGHARWQQAEGQGARIAVRMPATMRNGIYFEMRIDVTARRDIDELVIEVPERLWRDMTINAQVPQAREEKFRDGAFRFQYGKLKAGETMTVKVDGQVNPPLVGRSVGAIRALDGDAVLAALPLSIEVLP